MRRTLLLFLSVVAVVALGCGKKAAKSGSGRAEAWLVDYLNDQRVGYSVFRVQPMADGLQFESYIRLKLAMAGKQQDIQSRSTVTTASDLTMREFDFSFGSQDQGFSATGRVEDGKLIVTQAGHKPRTTVLNGPVFPLAAVGRMVATSPLKKDSLFRLPVFDVAMLDVGTAEIQVLGREKIAIGAKEYDAIKYTTKLSKVTMTSWVDADGLVLREESPPKMRSERADMKDVLANETGNSQVDVLRIFSVPVDTIIQEPELVRRAKLQLSGIEAGEYEFASDNQKVVTQKPLVLEITTPEPPATPVPLPVTDGDEYLKPTTSVQCDDAAIKRQAAAEVGKLTDAVEATRKLASWVFTAMDKQATASFPTAADVLASIKGDCNEHSVLLAALCRAAGIPTKVVVGLVYLNGAFYYHAWNEVLLDRWIPVDATFGEFPAGALRMRLAEGEISKQAEILGLVGRLQIKILEYSR